MTHAYKGLPDSSFWMRAMATISADEVDPVTETPFNILEKDVIATAGSCFAQHIARVIQENGFNYLVTEDGPEAEGYRVFPARFGNIYTVRQLLQLFDRAYGLCEQSLPEWFREDGTCADPFRPNIVFEDRAAMEADQQAHLAAVRQMFEKCSIFVFTLGLTESWRAKETGMIVPIAPGVIASPESSSDEYEFYNASVSDMVSDMQEFVAKIRSVNASVRLILTVSPVSLMATFEQRHVLVSTVYSKSALRVVAEEISQSDSKIAYFPSYEIITGQHNKYRFMASDLREVTREGVDHVMHIFTSHFLGGNLADTVKARVEQSSTKHNTLRETDDLYDIVCDEEALDL